MTIWWEVLLAGVAVMVRDKYSVRLALEQREELRRLIRVGQHPARVTASILLKSYGWRAPQVAEAVEWPWACTGSSSAGRRVGRGSEGPSPGQRRKLDDRGEAHLIALACSPPPAGHDRPCACWLARWWS